MIRTTMILMEKKVSSCITSTMKVKSDASSNTPYDTRMDHLMMGPESRKQGVLVHTLH